MAASVTTYSNYSYSNAGNTYTLDQFIACQSSSVVCYSNLSFIDHSDEYNIDYNTWNVASDYIEEMRDMCVTVELTEAQYAKYKYKPKLLCYDIYSNGELFFLLLIINDIYSIKQFTKRKLLMPTINNMTDIAKQIYNSNKTAIQEYANTNKLSE